MEQLVQRDRSNAYNHRALGKLYHRVGKFENAIAAFREVAALEPDNLEGFYTIATSHWEKPFRDTRLSDEQRLESVMLGIIEVNKALALKTDRPPTAPPPRPRRRRAAPPCCLESRCSRGSAGRF